MVESSTYVGNITVIRKVASSVLNKNKIKKIFGIRSGYRNSMANFGLNLIFSACCLNSNAIVIAVPPSITLTTPIIGHPLMAPVAVTPSARQCQ